MPITDLIPWKKREPEPVGDVAEGELPVREDPVVALEQQMDQLFDRFFEGSGLGAFGGFSEGRQSFSPRVDMVDTGRAIQISVELPGLDEKDIEVGWSRQGLTISGEKRQEKEERGQRYLRSERLYGSFSRSIPLPSDIDAGRADARYRNGVLTITLPRTARAPKRIAVRAQ